MKASDLPTRITVPFANSAGAGYVRDVPVASQIGIQNGAASFEDGYPPLNFLPVGSGGVPPFGQDMNGLFRQITRWTRWQSSGGTVPFNASFSSDIGGYPKGSIVASAVTFGLFWYCLADDNTTNPDTGGANWASFQLLTPTVASGLSPTRILYLTSGTSFTLASNETRIRARGWGGGGGGGAATGGSAAAGGGGAGGFFEVYLTGLTPGSTINYAIGAGGAAGTAGGNGGNGGTTTLTGIASATGGSGGTGGSGTGFGGGGGGTGSLSVGNGLTISGGGGGSGYTPTSGAYWIGGTGGGAPFNSLTDYAAGDSAGHTGAFPGGGGGGGSVTGNGGAGAAGYIEVEVMQ